MDRFVRTYGAMDKIVYDGAKEQVGGNTEFHRAVRKYEIRGHSSKKQQSNNNSVKECILERRRRWYQTTFWTYYPRSLWCYGIPWVATIMQSTASFPAKLQGHTPFEAITGETPTIYQYLDFGFYDRVFFKEDAGLGEKSLGWLLGVSHQFGYLTSYWILPESGIPVSITTLQQVTNREGQTDQNKKRVDTYDKLIADRFNKQYLGDVYLKRYGEKPEISMWEELAGDDEVFQD